MSLKNSGGKLNFYMPKILSFAIIVWIFVFLLPVKILASLYVPPSYAILSDNNQFMLVMCSDVKTNYDEGCAFTLPSGQQINLREKFKTNGVYRLDNFECVQPLDWFADHGELFASGDFDIVIRLNRFAVESQSRTNWSWCLKFYNQGKEVKQYQVKDLVGIPHQLFLPFTSSGWHTVWHETAAFTSGGGLYPLAGSYHSLYEFILVTEPQFFGRIKLSDGNVFVFNPFTGEIVQQWRHHPLIKFLIMAILVLLACCLVLFFCIKMLRRLFRNLWPKKV